MKEDLANLAPPPPLVVSQQADNYLVTTQVPASTTLVLLKKGGMIRGLEIRPWLSRGETFRALATKIMWLKVLDTTPKL